MVCRFIKKFMSFSHVCDDEMCENCKYFYTKDLTFEKDGDVGIWWFPRCFSQSHFGSRAAGSNACTLIVLLIAHKCFKYNLKIQYLNQDPPEDKLINSIAESIIEGNEIHENLLKTGQLEHINFTVPEAIQAAGTKLRCLTEWKSLVYMMDMRDSLHNELLEQLNEWNMRPPERCGSDLFVVLIAENRSVILVFQKELQLITLIDSHQHLPHGAVMAQVPHQKLSSLCHWFHNVFLRFYGASPDCYELSYLYFKRFEFGEMAVG